MTTEDTGTGAPTQDNGGTTAPATQTTTAPATTTPAPQEANMPNWVKTRLAEMTNQKYTMKQQIDAVTAENANLKAMIAKGQTPQNDAVPKDQVRQLVQQEAKRIAAQEAFDNECNKIYDVGTKEFPDFKETLGRFSQLGGLPPQVIEAANEVGDAHVILYHLAKDLDKADSLYKMTPIKLTAEMGKLQRELTKRTRTVSSAPPPTKTIDGRSSPEKSDDDLEIKDWMVKREQYLADKKEREKASR